MKSLLAELKPQLAHLAIGNVPLTFDQWLVCAAMGTVAVWTSELCKLVHSADNPAARHVR